MTIGILRPSAITACFSSVAVLTLTQLVKIIPVAMSKIANANSRFIEIISFF
jgi:hypothetical protein